MSRKVRRNALGATLKAELIYKLEDVPAEEGVDLFEIAPVLMDFGRLIRSASNVLDLGQEIDIRVRPFREGSWITEFVLHSTVTSTLLNYLKTEEGRSLASMLAFLGFGAKDGIAGVAAIIRFTRGAVSNFTKNSDTTVTYANAEGDELIVTASEHQLVQSPLVQINYYNSVIAPLDKFPSASAVSVLDGAHEVQRFTAEDRPAFEEYAKAELSDVPTEDNATVTHGLYIKPRRGSYTGEEKQYSFCVGETSLYPVTIEDEDFLARVRTGEVRLFGGDVLRVDLDTRQKRSGSKVSTSYAITRVIEYVPYEIPDQFKMNEHLSE